MKVTTQVAIAVLAVASVAGCSAQKPPRGSTVEDRLVEHHAAPPALDSDAESPYGFSRHAGPVPPSTLQSPETGEVARARPTAPQDTGAAGPQPAIAWVNEQPIPAARFDNLLFESHALFAMEQLIGLELVKDRARRDGMVVKPEDVDAEYRLSIEEMARAVVEEGDEEQLWSTGEEMLRTFLREKNFSLAEYMLSMERNAYLRKLVADSVTVTEQEVTEDYERNHGRRVVARHIVLPTLKAARDVLRRAEAGEDFAELARSHSLHRMTAAAGGLLPPFTEHDEQVPALIRQAGFGLLPGQVSGVLAIGGQFHLLRVEYFLEADQGPPDGAALSDLRARLLARKTRQAMQDLERQLFDQAHIRIEDPELRRQFMDKHEPRSGR